MTVMQCSDGFAFSLDGQPFLRHGPEAPMLFVGPSESRIAVTERWA